MKLITSCLVGLGVGVGVALGYWWYHRAPHALTAREEADSASLVDCMNSADVFASSRQSLSSGETTMCGSVSEEWEGASLVNTVEDVIAGPRLGGAIVEIALQVKARKGLLERTEANRLMVDRLVTNLMEERGMRPSHIARQKPICVSLVFVPLDADIFAKKVEASAAVANQIALYGANWWSRWCSWRLPIWQR